METNEFLEEMARDIEYLVAYLYFQDNILPEIWQEEDEYLEEISQPEYEEGMFDQIDEFIPPGYYY